MGARFWQWTRNGEAFSSIVVQAETDRIRLKPKLHVFGHVHSGHGMTATASTYFVNASLPDEEFELSNRPIILNFSPTL